MKRPLFLLPAGLLALTLLGLSACGLAAPSATAQPSMDITLAYATIAVRLTQAAIQQPAVTAQPTALATWFSLPTIASSLTPSPTHTPLPPTPTIVCDQAVAGSPIDVTIPDDSLFKSGDGFTKIWRLQNAGGCTWTTQYAARFFYGSQMGAPDIVYLKQDVPPGGTLEIAVDMIAPFTPGTHQSNWKLSNATGRLFGIGPSGDAPFWVRIVVLAPNTPTPTTTPSATASPSPTPTPSPTATSTPPVQVNQAAELALNQSINLDDGQIGAPAGADMSYQLDGSGFHMLLAQSTARLGIVGDNQPSQAACKEAAMSQAPIAIESLAAGTYLCYQTDQGLPGWLRFNALNSDNHSMKIEFLTWALP